MVTITVAATSEHEAAEKARLKFLLEAPRIGPTRGGGVSLRRHAVACRPPAVERTYSAGPFAILEHILPTTAEFVRLLRAGPTSSR